VARDLRYAGRQLWKNPGFVLTAVITLALGISANTALFSLVKAVLLTPPPYPDPGRLVRVWSSMPERGFNQSSTSMPDYLAMREKNRSLEELGAYMQTSFNVTERQNPERVVAARVTASLLRVLNIAPAAGGEFTDAAERWGEHRLVLISEGFWRRRFGGSASAIGQTLLLDEEPFKIAGVLPASFRFPDAHRVMDTLIVSFGKQ
jgi:putative ABC transport system permease protein